ncbi:MAG: elongation factor 1-beta [Promethearchaeota archaeon]
MANVLSILKVIPTSPEVNRDELVSRAQTEVREGLDLEILKKEEEPLFFGLYAIKLFVKTADSDEGTETLQKFEDRLIALEEVDNCEIEVQTIIDY